MKTKQKILSILGAIIFAAYSFTNVANADTSDDSDGFGQAAGPSRIMICHSTDSSNSTIIYPQDSTNATYHWLLQSECMSGVGDSALYNADGNARVIMYRDGGSYVKSYKVKPY